MTNQTEGAEPQPVAVSVERIIELLAHGEMDLQGLVPWSSNYTFLVVCRSPDLQAVAIYKPRRGETPLWDFDAGTLCQREVASYLLSRELGWPDIPPVVLRNGPRGVGSVQLFVDNDVQEHFFTMRRQAQYESAFRRVALFDYVVNNADRKGGHLLNGSEGQVWAIDHGLTFHTQYKLRTVIWDYAGQGIEEPWLAELENLAETLADENSPLCQGLSRLICREEMGAVKSRLGRLLRHRVYPKPHPSMRNVPYPLV